VRTAISREASSLPTMTARGAPILIEWTKASAARLVFISAAMAPIRLRPSQIAMYSAQFGIIKLTTSPALRP
jgi:hypothetical protein